MPYSVNYDEAAAGSEIIPEGEYECIIKYAGEDATKGGTMYMGATLIIRNDIDQPCKSQCIWHHIWQKKEPSPADLACGGYSSKQINSLSKAAHLPNGKKYESLADWADDLKNRCVRVTVEHDTYQGKTNAKVKWINETKHPECKHRWKDADVDIESEPEQQDFKEVPGVADSDLPF